MKLETVGKIMSVVAAVGGAALAILSEVQIRKTAKLIDEAVTNLEEADTIKIEEDLVKKAINRAVDNKVEVLSGGIYMNVHDKMLRQVDSKVESMVNGLYSAAEEEVTNKMAEEVAKIDQERLKKDVTERAKKIMLQKFDGQLDGLLEEANAYLGNVGKIYSSIAKKMEENSSAPAKNINLSLG